MIFLLTYLSSNNEPHAMEWVVPTGWNTATIAAHFEQRFPAATLLGMEPVA